MSRLALGTLALLAALGGCEGSCGRSGGGRAARVARGTPGPPDLAEAGRAPEFQAAVADFAREVGGAAPPIGSDPRTGPEGGLPGGFLVDVPHDRVEASLERWHDAYLPRGAFVLRFENRFAAGGQPDILFVLPTKDKWTALRAVRTDGANFGISNEEIVAWLQEMDAEHPVKLLGAGIDFVEGRFLSPPGEAAAQVLAAKMYSFCPDVVDQGTQTVPRLASELQTGRLFLWWD